MTAAYLGHFEVCEFLVSNGADVTIKAMECAKFGKNEEIVALLRPLQPLKDQFMMACISGELEDIQTLLKELKTQGIDINIQDAKQKTGLHYAVENNHNSVVDLLLKNKADVNIPDANGNSVLHIAAMKGFITITKVLLKHGAKIDAKEIHGFTPLILAAQEGHLKVVELIVSKRADINAKTNDGSTALHLASYKGNLNICRYLIS